MLARTVGPPSSAGPDGMIWLKMLVVMIPTEVPPEGSLAQREGGQWACVYMSFPFPECECSDKCYHRQMLDQSVARDYCSRGATTNHGGVLEGDQ